MQFVSQRFWSFHGHLNDLLCFFMCFKTFLPQRFWKRRRIGIFFRGGFCKFEACFTSTILIISCFFQRFGRFYRPNFSYFENILSIFYPNDFNHFMFISTIWTILSSTIYCFFTSFYFLIPVPEIFQSRTVRFTSLFRHVFIFSIARVFFTSFYFLIPVP